MAGTEQAVTCSSISGTVCLEDGYWRIEGGRRYRRTNTAEKFHGMVTAYSFQCRYKWLYRCSRSPQKYLLSIACPLCRLLYVADGSNDANVHTPQIHPN